MKQYQTHLLESDLLVTGGGMSGVCCAIAAARQGVKVILCQDRPVLGGNASSEIRMNIVGANTNRPAEDLVIEAREGGLIEEIRLENAVQNPQRSPSLFDQILYDKCRSEPNLTVMLNTAVVGAEVVDGKISKVEALRTSTEDRFEIRAKIFVDCTGDGALGAAAGAAYIHGREAQATYNETLAPVAADNRTLGSTLLFMGRKHDRPMPFTPPPWARKVTEEDMLYRDWAEAGRELTYEYGFWWLEWGGELNTIKDNEAIRDELLAILFGVWDYVKNKGDFKADHWALDWFGVIPGKRESRRFLGQYVMTEADVLTSTRHADAIAYGGWPIDLHPVGGFDDTKSHPCTWTTTPFLYDIPLRSCLARDLSNLMFAGRNISASHIAFASTRVMATCAVIGEGVGISAAHAVKLGVEPSALVSNPAAIQSIQQTILQEDGYLIGVKLDESENLLSKATLTASSEQTQGRVENLLSGQNRALQGDRSVPPSRQRPGTHRWISAPETDLPATVLAQWPTPETLTHVEIVFDTGLHRHLTLTFSDGYFNRMIWGQPSPETVRDFSLEAQEEDGRWSLLAEVKDNSVRRWKYLFSNPFRCKALRLVVKRTWGIGEARVVRIAVR